MHLSTESLASAPATSHQLLPQMRCALPCPKTALYNSQLWATFHCCHKVAVLVASTGQNASCILGNTVILFFLFMLIAVS